MKTPVMRPSHPLLHSASITSPIRRLARILSDYLLLIRWRPTGLAALLTVLAGAPINIGKSALAAFAVACIAAAGFASNDCFDYSVDSVNEPTRALPSGRVSRRQAWLLALILFSLGNLCGFIQSPQCFAVTATVTALLFAYSTILKRIIALAAAVTACMVIGILLYLDFALAQPVSTLFIIAPIFTFVFVRELMIDIAHAPGDNVANRRTLPILLGSPNALVVVRLLFLIAGVIAVYSATQPRVPQATFILLALYDIYLALRLTQTTVRQQRAVSRIAMLACILTWHVGR